MDEVLYEIGDEVKVVDIHRLSQWYIDKDKFINKTGKLTGFIPYSTYGEWMICGILFDEDSLNKHCYRKQPGSNIKGSIVVYGCRLRKVGNEYLIPM